MLDYMVGMEFASNLERAVLYEHNSIGLEYFERREGLLFGKDAKLEVFLQSSDDLQLFRKELRCDRLQISTTLPSNHPEKTLVRLKLNLQEIQEFCEVSSVSP